MSRYLVLTHDPNLLVFVGWNPCEGTYYAHVHNVLRGEEDYPSEAWFGMGKEEDQILSTSEIARLLAPWVTLPMHVEESMAQDRYQNKNLISLEQFLEQLQQELEGFF